MIGRGGLAIPKIGKVIMNNNQPIKWVEVCQLILNYSRFERDQDAANYLPSRIKQWFSYLKRGYDKAECLFNEIKIEHFLIR